MTMQNYSIFGSQRNHDDDNSSERRGTGEQEEEAGDLHCTTAGQGGGRGARS